MSDFNKLDRPIFRDHFADFRVKMAAELEYRNAYAELSARDPNAALTMPHPDDPKLDVQEALRLIRGAGGSLTTDGRVDLKS